MGGWLGGAAGEMKNKAKLSLNWVLAGALAELGKYCLLLDTSIWAVFLTLDIFLLQLKKIRIYDPPVRVLPHY